MCTYALKVRIAIDLSFPWTTPGHFVAGWAFAAQVIDLAE